MPLLTYVPKNGLYFLLTHETVNEKEKTPILVDKLTWTTGKKISLLSTPLESKALPLQNPKLFS